MGSGNLVDQGTSSADAGNNFNKGLPGGGSSWTNPSSNSNVDIFWINNSTVTTNFYYYKDPFGSIFIDEIINGLFEINYVQYVNGTTASGILGNNFSTAFNTNNLTTCYGQWKKDPTEIGEIQPKAEAIQVYPNPSMNIFTIALPESSLQKEYILEVTDMLGRRIYTQRLTHITKTQLNAESWSHGAYQLRITEKDGKTYQQRIIKLK